MRKLTLLDDVRNWVRKAQENGLTYDDIMDKMVDIQFIHYQIKNNFWDERALKPFICETLAEMILRGDL